MWSENLKNGKVRYVERYQDFLTGQYKKVSVVFEKDTVRNRKEAQKELQRRIDQSQSGKPEKEYTLKDLVDEYRADQEHSVKISTYARNYHACATLMNILGEDVLVNRLTSRYVRDKLQRTGKDPDTLNEHLTRFRALIRWGYKNDIVSDISFLEKIERFDAEPHRIKIQDKYLESDELKKLLLDMDGTFWALLTEFMALSGLRFSEACALEKEDVDLDAREIHITKGYDSVNKRLTTAKNFYSLRDVYIQPELMAICKRINSYMLRQRLMYNLNSSLFMFNTDGGYISYFSFNKYLKKHAMAITGKHITVHALRHTHASLLLEQGVSIDAIARRLGHGNSKITREIYLHVTDKLRKADNEVLSQIKILYIHGAVFFVCPISAPFSLSFKNPKPATPFIS